MKRLEFKSKAKGGKEKVRGSMEIKNKTQDSAQLYIYGDIVSSEWGKWEDTDTAPEDVRNFLKEVEGLQNIDIYINSGGGSVFAGMAIYNMLRRNKAYKTVHVDGLAASISSVIALAGDKIIIPSNAYFMVHKPWTLTYGNSNDLRKTAETLDTIEEGMMNVYGENLKDGVDIEAVKNMVNEETWLTGSEAAQYFEVEAAESNMAAACISDYFKSYTNTPDKLKGQEPTGGAENKKTEIENALKGIDVFIAINK